MVAQDATTDPATLAISDVRVRTTAGGQATLTWTTNLPSASGVKYGPDPYSQTMTARNASPRREHEISLTGLQSGVTYYYTIVAQRGDDRATWPAAGEIQPSFVAQSPLSTSLTVDSVQVSPLPGTGVVVSWKASRPATALVEYGPAGGPLDRVGRTAESTSDGQMVLTGLERDDTYSYRLTLTDAAGSTAVYPVAGSPPATFTSPVGGVGASSVTTFRAGSATGVDIASRQDGELRLAGSLSSDFDVARALPAGTVEDEESRGVAKRERGSLVLDGERWVSARSVPVNRSLEAEVTFEGQGNQAFGLAGTGASVEFAGVVNRGGVLRAGVRDASGSWQFAPLPRRVRDLVGEPISITVIQRSERCSGARRGRGGCQPSAPERNRSGRSNRPGEGRWRAAPVVAAGQLGQDERDVRLTGARCPPDRHLGQGVLGGRRSGGDADQGRRPDRHDLDTRRHLVVLVAGPQQR